MDEPSGARQQTPHPDRQMGGSRQIRSGARSIIRSLSVCLLGWAAPACLSLGGKAGGWSLKVSLTVAVAALSKPSAAPVLGRKCA
ncbi:hypothetical protein BJX65DRAFT_189089 [Aspergillus insuetus]